MNADRPTLVAVRDAAATLARGAGGDRLSAILADIVIPAKARPTERQRAALDRRMEALLADLLDRFAVVIGEPLDLPGSKALERLRATGLVVIPGLIETAILFAQAGELRPAPVTANDEGLLVELVGDAQGSVAAAAMDYVTGKGRRTAMRLLLEDLDAETAGALLLRTAALVAVDARVGHDRALEAAKSMLGGYDESRGLFVLADRLARALDAAGQMGPERLIAASFTGDAVLLASMLARRAGGATTSALDALTRPAEDVLGDLLALSGLDRGSAAALLSSWIAFVPSLDAARAIARFDGADRAALERLRADRQRPLEFRTALERLSA
ncbi:hypothetical protein [Sphingomicrobium nitratireducens]|uniref:hypothetical protein n=1 Tax=Sphingomicrobium nitratireducens TaxID=2964666 RepID=UPI00223E9DBB|nr:hypothetical protein [Sphingomicrobium nitratireducens]